jgi:hypothetical protein
MQVWDAIDQGSSDMQIPAYNGGLFGIDPELHPAGHLIRSLSIPDRVMKPALKALLIDDHTEDGVAGKVDFRSLSVREFGTIYEGLLESSLSVAEQDLTVDKKGAWVPAKEGEAILASANEVYFHSASGERKATGSYYTPSFVVDHLIERSVEPALKAHLAKVKIKIDAGDQLGAYEDFFDFRVADLAMGSAHFLVAAIDKIEAVMRSFLIQEGNRVDGVEAELMRLENAAKLALGDDEAAYAEIERSSLLRRQIARRCIYGLDINPLAVELSRLAIWIHTFVPGLPMSSLEHGLVCANSLTGIGSVEEGLNALIPQREKVGTSLFDGVVEESLTMARDLLIDLANADEADKAGAKRAVEIAGEARQAASKSKLMFDLAVANRSGVLSSGGALSEEDLRELYSNEELSSFVNETNPAHMPYLFPEVFLKTDPGFDAVLGNPPWERPFMDKTRFWAARSPGLLGLRVEVRNRKIEELEAERPDLAEKFDQEVISADRVREVLSSRFNLGVGHADLYKAFGWVALSLICRGAGRIAFVLPKTAFSAAGGEHWRRALQSQGSISELTYLVNTGRWAFDIEGRYSIALMVYTKGLDEDLLISGPVHSRAEFELLPSSKAVKLDRNLLMSFTETASIPSVRDQRTAEVLQKMRKSPSLKNFAGGKFRPVSELNATTDRPSFDHGASEGRLPVMSGRSFNIWQPDAGPMFAWADSEVVVPILNRKLERQMRLRSSAFYGFDLEKDLGGLHPLFRPRIAFRAITNPTNSRTFICALVPPERILTHISPYILTPIGNEAQESYLLGVMSSLIFDWYTRKFIETAADLHLVRAFPIPEISDERLSSRITQLAGNLAAVDKRYFDWANRAGVSMGGGLTDSDRISLVAELDGLVALAYRLNTDDLRHLYASFHRGWTDPVRLEIAASTMENWG